MAQVDLKDYEGREPAYIKHKLISGYLPEWGHKIGNSWDSMVVVDGFAGPWGTKREDYADSSFGIAAKTLREVQQALLGRGRKVPIRLLLVEKSSESFVELEKFAEENSHGDFQIVARNGEFVDYIPEFEKIIGGVSSSPFRFVLLDPKGWADIPMQELKPFLNGRSCEVLINLMTRHILRFLEEDTRAESYNRLFGRPGVLEKLQAAPKSERADLAVREYCRSLKNLCGFKYVSSAAILEADKESVRYFMVFATNHAKGVEVFKRAETEAAKLQDEIRHRSWQNRSSDLVLQLEAVPSRIRDDLHRVYRSRAKIKVLKALIEGGDRVPYEKLYCEAMAFPLVTHTDLNDFLRSLEPNAGLHLPEGKKVPSIDRDDMMYVRDRGALQKLADREKEKISALSLRGGGG